MVVAVVLKERRREGTGGGSGAGGRRGSGGTGRWEAAVETDHTIQASKLGGRNREAKGVRQRRGCVGVFRCWVCVKEKRKRVTGEADGGWRVEGGG